MGSRRLTVWAQRQAHARRAVELQREHPDWTFGEIAKALADEGMTATSGAPHPPTNVILLLMMLGEFGFPDWLLQRPDD